MIDVRWLKKPFLQIELDFFDTASSSTASLLLNALHRVISVMIHFSMEMETGHLVGQQDLSVTSQLASRGITPKVNECNIYVMYPANCYYYFLINFVGKLLGEFVFSSNFGRSGNVGAREKDKRDDKKQFFQLASPQNIVSLPCYIICVNDNTTPTRYARGGPTNWFLMTFGSIRANEDQLLNFSDV
ncbi:hypothetical protein CsSME_00009244 [Camellia sinensis var. sinensis]